MPLDSLWNKGPQQHLSSELDSGWSSLARPMLFRRLLSRHRCFSTNSALLLLFFVLLSLSVVDPGLMKNEHLLHWNLRRFMSSFCLSIFPFPLLPSIALCFCCIFTLLAIHLPFFLSPLHLILLPEVGM